MRAGNQFASDGAIDDPTRRTKGSGYSFNSRNADTSMKFPACMLLTLLSGAITLGQDGHDAGPTPKDGGELEVIVLKIKTYFERYGLQGPRFEPEVRAWEEIKALGALAVPAYKELFNRTDNAQYKAAIVHRMLSSDATRAGGGELIDLLLNSGNHLSTEKGDHIWLLQALLIAAEYDSELARRIALKSLTLNDSATLTGTSLTVLSNIGTASDIAELQRYIASLRQAGSSSSMKPAEANSFVGLARVAIDKIEARSRRDSPAASGGPQQTPPKQ